MRLTRAQLVGGVLTAVTAIAGTTAYALGWPSWLVILLAVFYVLPLVIRGAVAERGLLRRYRFLLYVIIPALGIGSFEAWQHDRIPEQLAESLDLPPGPGEPDLFFEGDLPGVLVRLYPDRSETMFVRGFQIKLCYDDQIAMRAPPEICRDLGQIDLHSIRSYYERAIAQQAKHDENLYYHYVEILIRLQESPEVIDAAAAEWKRQFPFSNRLDPRTVFRP